MTLAGIMPEFRSRNLQEPSFHSFRPLPGEGVKTPQREDQLDPRQLSLTTWSFSCVGSDNVAPPLPVIVISEAPLRLSMRPEPPAMHSSK